MSFVLPAYAKINLTLEALARRDDGYHEIVSVLQTISLADTLSFELSDSLELRCSVPSLQSADNLVLRASNLLAETATCSKGALIHLTKGIPIASGLGSGATDAATTLVGLNQLWELEMPRESLVELGAKLGSDVPFFLHGGTALAEGRGERITPLPLLPEVWVVLLRPAIEPVPVKTAHLYSQLSASHFTSGEFTQRAADHIRQERKIDDSLLLNVFDHVAFDSFPELFDYRSRFLAAGAQIVHVAGSGPTMFALVRDHDQGKTILNNLEADGLEAYLVRSVEAAPSAQIGD